MKKFSLLLGTLGGGLAGYLFSNKKLRDQIANAKDGEEAAKLLGLHLQKDGKRLAKQVQEFVRTDEVQRNVKKAKKFAQKKVDDAKKELDSVIDTGSKNAKKVVKNVTKSAGTKAKRAAKKGKTKAKKTASNAKKTAKKATRRMKTKVRKVS
ncbi:MAG: hypothetical protein QF815_01555 [Candidatus Peribacteraceae bacterium]|jgi:vacuolar-type H+-ATPase subunit H|nr:hypothetical protein [Candidatus Peribacteraceae bacterium]MDP7477532.1 hypothetical protein [Candidatus Peribacteraceae bacterium]